ncbi:MAG: ComF family protein [Oscillospiraceae bacterium]
MRARDVGRFALDLLFPRRCPFCGKVLGFSATPCGCETSREAILLPGGPLAVWDLGGEPFVLGGVWACYTYAEPVRGMIIRMKYEDEPELAVPLAEKLAERFGREALHGAYDALVPVPMHPKAEKKRGYNQCVLMARALAGQVGLPCLEDALKKTRPTERQMSLDRQGRLANLKGAFAAQAERVAGKRLLLVDDVFTTGATLNECAKALLAAGAESCGGLCTAASSPNYREVAEGAAR